MEEESDSNAYKIYEGEFISGYILTYRVKRGFNTRLVHLLYGRLHKTYKPAFKMLYSYYYPGYLDATKFKRMGPGIIYLEDYPAGLIRALRPMCADIQIREEAFLKHGMLTGLDYWKRHAEKRNIQVKWWGDFAMKQWGGSKFK